MFKTKFLLGLIFTLWGYTFLGAQVDTSLVIQEVSINATSIRNENLGGKNDLIYKGEANSQSDLTNLLLNQGGIYIKSYGSNSLGTSSIRGGSAGHSLILWNGVPLQSPTLGLLDLSLISINVMDMVSVQKGGNSALWGSGAIGGVINLENSSTADNFLQGQLNFGSFGQFSSNIALGYGKEGYYGKTKVSHTQAKNNFKYASANGSPLIEQMNAAFTTTNINQDLYFTINNKQSVELHYWWQNSTKEIPPTLTQTFSDAYQEDQANRLILSWNRISNQHKSSLKFAVLDEEQQFVDPIINLISNNNFTQWFGEAGHSIYLGGQHQLMIGTTIIETSAKANGYVDKISETKVGFWISQQLDFGKFMIQASLREEMVEGILIPIIPSAGIVFQMTENLGLRTKVSRNYRLPTLNDKYWRPGGNLDLIPESGWSQELGLSFQKSDDDHKVHFDLTGFNRNIDNWILWSPAENFNFWRAQNLTEVWSRGIETSVSYKYSFKNIWLDLQSNYNYIRSTNQVAISLPKLDKGQQLIYTPVHQIGSQITFGMQHFSLSYQHQFTGKNLGINEAIPAYHLGNLLASYKIENKQFPIKLFLNIQNVWNAQYVVIERRPMPGTNFQLGIKFKINKQT